MTLMSGKYYRLNENFKGRNVHPLMYKEFELRCVYAIRVENGEHLFQLETSLFNIIVGMDFIESLKEVFYLTQEEMDI